MIHISYFKVKHALKWSDRPWSTRYGSNGSSALPALHYMSFCEQLATNVIHAQRCPFFGHPVSSGRPHILWESESSKLRKSDLLIYYLGTNQRLYESNSVVTNRFAEVDIFCMRKLIRIKQNDICPTLVTLCLLVLRWKQKMADPRFWLVFDRDLSGLIPRDVNSVQSCYGRWMGCEVSCREMLSG